MENNFNYNIPKEKFVFANTGKSIHDKELATKPIGYLKDAWYRFRKNKGSIFATYIIVAIILFAIVVPILSPYKVSDEDPYYKFSLPKLTASENYTLNFWDGCIYKEVNETDFLMYTALGVETGESGVKNNEYKEIVSKEYSYNQVKSTAMFKSTQTYYTRVQTGDKKNPFAYEEAIGLVEADFNLAKTKYYTRSEIRNVKYGIRYDSYAGVGLIFKSLTMDEYYAIQQYQDETGIQVIYPMTDKKLRPTETEKNRNPNYWMKTYVNENKKDAISYTIDETTGEYKFENIYIKLAGIDSSSGTYQKVKYDDKKEEVGVEAYSDDYFSKVRFEGEGNYQYGYAVKNQTGYEVRLNYHQYYKYLHERIYKDNIKEPCFIFGANAEGKDLLVCLSSGARFSLIFAVIVSVVNLIVGAIYGAIEGYYGGAADMIMERVVDVLSAVPFMIVITLLNYHMKHTSQALILFIAFFATGWIGMAGRTRMQFYRFKNQEYVLAARTLGANDRRVMFKHIFPNSLGTLITGCVLTIPGMIFSETSLSYLGIINLSTGNITSVGTLLANGQPYLTSYPHIIISPAIFISLLMLSFNLFGNGLRDAFNPSLRGSED